MRKFSKAEKTIIALGDSKNYQTYDCPSHGVYQVRNDEQDHVCVYCKKKNPKIADIEDLQQKFKVELGFQ